MSGLVLKSAEEIQIMHEANTIVQQILGEIANRVKPGMTTMEIDLFAEAAIRDA